MAQLPNALLAIVAVACIISCMSCVNASQRKVLQQAKQAQTRRTTKYTLNVTTGSASPDCFTRRVILINGKFMPTLEVAQGDWLEVRRTERHTTEGSHNTRLCTLGHSVYNSCAAMCGCPADQCSSSSA